MSSPHFTLSVIPAEMLTAFSHSVTPTSSIGIQESRAVAGKPRDMPVNFGPCGVCKQSVCFV